MVDIAGQTGKSGIFEIPFTNTSTTTFAIRRIDSTQPGTVHYIVVDACGDWPTLNGGGANVWPIACNPRPDVSVVSQATADPKRLHFTISAQDNAGTVNNVLKTMVFAGTQNAKIWLPNGTQYQDGSTFSITPNAATSTFDIEQITPCQAAQSNVTVTDSCGSYAKGLVGGGANAFNTCNSTSSPSPAASPSPTNPSLIS